MMDMLTQFARTGDPNIEGIIQWPGYNIEEDKYMYIADLLEINTGFSRIKPKSIPSQPENQAVKKRNK